MAKMSEWSQRLIELDALGMDDRTIAAKLVSEGFKTKQGLSIDHRAVAQQRYTMNRKEKQRLNAVDQIINECRVAGTFEHWRLAFAFHTCCDQSRM